MTADGRAEDPAPTAPPAGRGAPPWLLGQRVTVPEPPAHYCHRPDLARRADPRRRPFTALVAPAGFGKTTLLAACCRGALADGVPVAWLTLANGDDPATLDAYVAYAFQRAGIDALDPLLADHAPLALPHPRAALALRAVETAGRPCILVLDELERARAPGAVALLGFLLRSAPPGLHLAVTYRALPAGLDAVADRLGGAGVLTAEDLRFSTPDIARFFDLALSRRQLAAAAADTGGWPIALQVRRNLPPAAPAAARVARDVMGSWIVGRFLQGFADDERRLVLDLALLDWIDAGLLDQALELPDRLARALALPGLAGLLERAGSGAPGVYRLHPLVREHCAAQHRRESPERCTAIMRRTALALARRGNTVEAMRSAAEAGDAALAGAILLDAGGIRMWLRDGAARLTAACRHLAVAATDAEPRLALARCAALLLDRRMEDAVRAYEDAGRTAPGDDRDFELDRLLARGALALNGGRAPTAPEIQAMGEDAARIAALPTTPNVVRAGFLFALATDHAHRAHFDAAAGLARQARGLARSRSTYLTMALDSLLGQVAMARGRVREARKHYRSARRIGRARFLEDPHVGVYADLMLRELALERNRAEDRSDHRGLARVVCTGPYHFARRAAAAELAIELERDAGGTAAALAMTEDLLERAAGAAVDVVVPLLAAHRIALLADAGRADDAARSWRAAGLPSTDAGCLDLDARGWREMEALAGARIRLLAARGRPGAAARLAGALARSAAARGLRRTHMRALALRLRLCHVARDRDGALVVTTEYLRLFDQTDYARPLVHEKRAAAALERIVAADPDGPLAATAARLLSAVRAGPASAAPRLTPRETEVLAQLAGRQDKEIAAALGVTPHGIRHHVRNIFRKLDVGDRFEADRRARALGILPPAG